MSECRMIGITLLSVVVWGGAFGFALYLIRLSLSTGSSMVMWSGVGIIFTATCMVLAIVAIVSKRLEEGWASASRKERMQR